jgi:hypothetical protein
MHCSCCFAGQGDVAAAWAGTGDAPTPPGATASLDLAAAAASGPANIPGSASSNGSSSSSSSSHHAPSHKIKSTELLPHAGRTANSRTSTAVHPHMVAKAQRFARAAQMQLAGSLPQKVLQQVKVMVNVHMDLQVGGTGRMGFSIMMLQREHYNRQTLPRGVCCRGRGAVGQPRAGVQGGATRDVGGQGPP